MLLYDKLLFATMYKVWVKWSSGLNLTKLLVFMRLVKLVKLAPKCFMRSSPGPVVDETWSRSQYETDSKARLRLSPKCEE